MKMTLPPTANLEVAADVVPLDILDQPVAFRRACNACAAQTVRAQV
jgi:hypothetical protein